MAPQSAQSAEPLARTSAAATAAAAPARRAVNRRSSGACPGPPRGGGQPADHSPHLLVEGAQHTPGDAAAIDRRRIEVALPLTRRAGLHDLLYGLQGHVSIGADVAGQNHMGDAAGSAPDPDDPLQTTAQIAEIATVTLQLALHVGTGHRSEGRAPDATIETNASTPTPSRNSMRTPRGSRRSPVAPCHREHGLGGSRSTHPDHPDCTAGESIESRIYLGTEGTAVTRWRGTLHAP